MDEVWRVIEGYPDYEVSNMGRVRSFKWNKPHILKPATDRVGYKTVMITNSAGIRNGLKVARLVAFAFVDGYTEELRNEVNHIDGDKTNNHVSNLEWVSRSENFRHAYESGLMDNTYAALSEASKGSGNKNAKLTESDVIRIKELLKEGDLLQREIAQLFNVDSTQISRINVGDTWSHVKVK